MILKLMAGRLARRPAAANLAALLAVAACSLVLAACGFQLRGAGLKGTLPFSSVQISGGTGAFSSNLKRYLVASGIQVTTDPKSAEAIIDIMQEARTRSILSLNSRGRVREYTLQYRLQFRIKDSAGAELLAPDDILLKRVQSFDESQALAKEAEAETLYRDMQDDMVQQVLRRITAIKPRPAAPDTAETTVLGTPSLPVAGAVSAPVPAPAPVR